MVAFSSKERLFFFYPCVDFFCLISPLFGLALSSTDAFWEKLQHLWHKRKQVKSMNKKCGLRLQKTVERNVDGLSAFSGDRVLPWNI